MPVVDWVFIAVLIVSLIVGAWRGLVFEVLSLVSWIAAFALAQLFAADVALWLPMSGATETARYAAGFVVVFVVAIFAGGLVAFLAGKMVAAIGLRPADRLLGAAFGVVRGAVLLLAVTLVVGMSPFQSAVWWQQASGPKVGNGVLRGLQPLMPQEFKKYVPSE